MAPQIVQCCAHDASSVDAVRRQVKLLTAFLKDYKWLTDAYLSDYFVLDHSQNIKPSWWEALKRMHLRELASFLKPDHWVASDVWPLSLMAFRVSIHSLPLSRLPIDAAPFISRLTRTRSYAGDAEDADTELGTKPAVDIQDGQCLLLDHCYRRHVKPKKQHEIVVLAMAIQQLSCQMMCSHVVDVGAGQGHLSRLLSYGYGLHVTTIEAASCHTPKAQKFDGEVERDISRGQCISRKRRKKLQNEPQSEMLDLKVKDGPAPSHVVAWIDADISVGQFLKRVREASDIPIPANPDNPAAFNLKVEEKVQNCREEELTRQHCKEKSSDLAGNPLCNETLASQKHCTQELASQTPYKEELATQHHCKEDLTPQYHCREDLTPQHHCRDFATQHHCKNLASQCQYKEELVVRVKDNADMSSSIQKQKCDDQNHMKGSDPTDLSSSNERDIRDEAVVAEAVGVTHRNESDRDTPPLVLTGLHACGDLTPTMLRVFVSCHEARGLASVGCCYMKMDIHEPDRGDRELGYPLSDYVGALEDHTLSWEAREMACHFIDAYYDRLIEADQDPEGQSMAHLRTHCYRAALQEIIAEKDPSIQHGSIKLTLKKAHRLPFTQYAAKALGRLGLGPSLSEAQTERADRRQDTWREVVAFYVLRLSLAPLLESLILLDRVLYLAENGINSAIIPVFDPAISPRNFVLLAAKD